MDRIEQGQESTASAAIETLKTEATELTREAKRASTEILEQRVDKLFGVVDDVERAVRAAANELEKAQHPRLAEYVNRAAEEVSHVRERFRGAEVGQLLSTTESLARTRPAVVLGVAFAVGFAFVRLLKDTAPTDRARNGHDEGGYDTQGTYSGGYLRGQYGDDRESSRSHRAPTQSFERSREDI